MKAQLQSSDGLQRKMNVEISQAEVQNAFEKVYQGIQRQVEIKGFRKGKAPLATVKSMYKDRVVGDVAQDLIQAHYPKAIIDQKVEPISYPEFEFEDPKENQDFKFTAIFDIRPEIKVKKWEGLEVEKEKYTFNDVQFEQSINNIRQSRAKTVDVLEVRPAQMGDTAVIDFEGFVDGIPLPGGTGTDHNLELGAKQFIEGFEDGIVGMNIGTTKTIALKFPDAYHSIELSGKPVEFKTTLKSLKKKEMPELNDELLVEIGTKQTVEEFKATLRKDIDSTEQKRIDEAFKNRLVKKLVAENPVQVPASLLKEQKAALIEDFKKRMTEQGMQEADFTDYVQKWDADFAKTASEMIQSSFLIDKLAIDHNLAATDADMEAKYQEYATQTGMEVARIKEWYASADKSSRLSYSITEEKVIHMIMAKAKIKEVDAKLLKEEQN